jgi:hypothetical protein
MLLLSKLVEAANHRDVIGWWLEGTLTLLRALSCPRESSQAVSSYMPVCFLLVSSWQAARSTAGEVAGGDSPTGNRSSQVKSNSISE